MKKSIAIILALIVLCTAVFTSCKKKDEEATTTTVALPEGIAAADNEIEFVDVEVTDENGKVQDIEFVVNWTLNGNGEYVAEITDADGNEYSYYWATDDQGNDIIKITDKDGNVIKDKDGNEVTVQHAKKYVAPEGSGGNGGNGGNGDNEGGNGGNEGGNGGEDGTEKTTKKPKPGEDTSDDESESSSSTTEADPQTPIVPSDTTDVPRTTDTGKPVEFADEDKEIIKNMLEVPYLYQASYENSNGVPINIATHAAIWMAQREGLSTSTYASGTIVIDLFKYFAQTVVHFKANCNDQGGNPNIVYNVNNDSFTINSFESKQQTVTITGVEDMGNNFYKVTGSVSGAGSYSKVFAIMERNKLDLSLGYSVKALRWQ